MEKQQSFADMAYANRRRKTKMDEFLETMDAVIEWTEWCAAVDPYYPAGKRGRPPRGVETMLRMYLLQNWYNLSDEGVEEAIYNTYPMSKFMGIDFMDYEQVPDATTLCKFRKLLDENGVTKILFESVKGFLEKHGKIMHGGSIQDATIIAAPSSTKNAKHERDPEMHQVKKGNQWYHGERLHIGVDAGSGCIHSLEVTAANAPERDEAVKLIREDDEVVYGDAGYVGIEEREDVKSDPHLSQIDWRINQKKPYTKKNPWKPGEGIRWHKYFNWQKSRVRCKVEYAFLVIKRIFHYNKVRYRGLHKNRTQAYTLCALANLYMVRNTIGAEAV
jgi:IS5 family transposase